MVVVTTREAEHGGVQALMRMTVSISVCPKNVIYCDQVTAPSKAIAVAQATRCTDKQDEGSEHSLKHQHASAAIFPAFLPSESRADLTSDHIVHRQTAAECSAPVSVCLHKCDGGGLCTSMMV